MAVQSLVDKVASKALFIKFLNENKLYEKFLKYAGSEHYSYESGIEKFTCMNPSEFISSSFKWDKTSEGFSFWEDKNELWNKYLSGHMCERFICKSLFIHFLKTNNAYDKFVENSEDKAFTEDFDIQYFTHARPENYVSVAFEWCYSPEGFDFWSKISIAWTSYVKKIRM